MRNYVESNFSVNQLKGILKELNKQLGILEVPCVIADDLTEDQIKAFRLADNKTSELAEWDLDKLSEELKFIEMDMSQFGFEDLEQELDREVLEDEFDENEAVSENPYSRKGDIFILGNHKLMCGDSTINDDVKKLVDGKQVDMPPKELELLYFLASSPNQVFTREQLLDHIWGYEYVGDTRTVDVHVKRLREKIKDHATWQIGTVWGIGYKFEVK